MDNTIISTLISSFFPVFEVRGETKGEAPPQNFSFDDVYIVDQGGKGQGLGESG